MSDLVTFLLSNGIFAEQGIFYFEGEITYEVPLRLLSSTFNNIEMGAYSYIAYACLIENSRMGRYCSVAPECKIGLGSHPISWMSSSPFPYVSWIPGDLGWSVPFSYQSSPQKTIIEHDVWIGYGSLITGGITIGTGAVIAAGAVVTKEVPP
jgi:acetyltransferase-like isoleucine patch superfamily enzyme